LHLEATSCYILHAKYFRLFLSEQQPASSLYLKLRAISTKSAASHYKTFGNVSLTLIPRTFWRRHLRN